MGQAEESILQVCQLTELKQTKEWGKYPNRFRHLYETLLPENLGRHCREWPAGKADSEIRHLIQENSKPQDLIVYTDGLVTKDQSGWGFIVKQGATTIHEDSAVYEVSTSSLTMEMEAVIHAIRWIASRGDNQTTRAIILIDSLSLLQKVEWEAQTGMCHCQCSTSTFETSHGCTVLDMLESKKMTEQIDWRAKQPSQAACVSEDLKW